MFIVILIFVENMGVRKTFTANILKQNFPENLVHSVYEKKFNYCWCDLIILLIFSTQEADANLVHKINYDNINKVQKHLISLTCILYKYNWKKCELKKKNVAKKNYTKIIHRVLKNDNTAQTKKIKTWTSFVNFTQNTNTKIKNCFPTSFGDFSMAERIKCKTSGVVSLSPPSYRLALPSVST